MITNALNFQLGTSLYDKDHEKTYVSAISIMLCSIQ